MAAVMVCLPWLHKKYTVHTEKMADADALKLTMQMHLRSSGAPGALGRPPGEGPHFVQVSTFLLSFLNQIN